MKAGDLRRDGWLWIASAAALATRGPGFVRGGPAPCVGDECTYLRLAERIVAGQGLTESHDWLAAPLYPYLLAASSAASGSVLPALLLQLALSLASLWLVAALARRVAGQRAARVAAFVFALHPTLAFFAGRLWTETLYAFLLLAATQALLWSRGGPWPRALLPGVLVGVCVLLRGVALLALPVFAVAALWPIAGERFRAAAAPWGHAAALAAAAVATVAPYSVHASLRHDGLVVSEATLGRMMWLGNNAFDPITFDWMRPADRGDARGEPRPRCPRNLGPVAWNACEVRAGAAWIREHPGEFLRRVPLRLAQLFNPNSFVTRHVRKGRAGDLPAPAAEGLVVFVIAASAVVWIGGTLGVWARGRGVTGAVSVGLAVSHVAAVAALAGLTRYRLPLESFWIVYAGAALADPRATWRALRARPARAAGCALTLAALLPLMARFLPAAWG